MHVFSVKWLFGEVKTCLTGSQNSKGLFESKDLVFKGNVVVRCKLRISGTGELIMSV